MKWELTRRPRIDFLPVNNDNIFDMAKYQYVIYDREKSTAGRRVEECETDPGEVGRLYQGSKHWRIERLWLTLQL